jgi:hypothetical protein
MNVETGSISTKTSRSSGQSTARSSKEGRDEGKEERRRRRRGPTGANVVAPDLPTFLQQQPRNYEKQTSRRSMDYSTSSSIPTLDSEEINQKWQLMEQMEILSMEEAQFEKQIEEAQRKLFDSLAVVNDTQCNEESPDSNGLSSDDDDGYVVPKSAFFIPGITGRAKCLSKIGEKEKESSSSEDDKTVQTELPIFFIPGITGQARCLKQSRRRSNLRSEIAEKKDSSSSKGKSIDSAAHQSLTRSIGSIRETLASRRPMSASNATR